MGTNWARAWSASLYGPRGFYVSGPGADEGPAGHFRTSVHVGAAFHRAMARLLLQVDAELGRPDQLDLVDVGAGRGELVTGVLNELPTDVVSRVRLLCLDVRARPRGLSDSIEWHEGVAPQSLALVRPSGVIGLMVAQEWLDDIPCDVIEIDGQGRQRLVLVDDDGRELLGPGLDDSTGCAGYDVDGAAAQQWLQSWWPVALPGARAEVGLPRDDSWAGLTAQLRAGTVVAIDYGHIRSGRLAGRYDAGTLSAYASGRQIDPVPDGRCDITAHVAMDSCAAAGRVDSDAVTLTRQRDALSELGVSGTLPPREQAAVDPVAYTDALQCASQGAELRDRTGLGAFWWLRVDRAAALTTAVAPIGWSGPRPAPCSPAAPGPVPAAGPAPRPGAAPPP